MPVSHADSGKPSRTIDETERADASASSPSVSSTSRSRTQTWGSPSSRPVATAYVLEESAGVKTVTPSSDLPCPPSNAASPVPARVTGSHRPMPPSPTRHDRRPRLGVLPPPSPRFVCTSQCPRQCPTRYTTPSDRGATVRNSIFVPLPSTSSSARSLYSGRRSTYRTSLASFDPDRTRRYRPSNDLEIRRSYRPSSSSNRSSSDWSSIQRPSPSRTRRWYSLCGLWEPSSRTQKSPPDSSQTRLPSHSSGLVWFSSGASPPSPSSRLPSSSVHSFPVDSSLTLASQTSFPLGSRLYARKPWSGDNVTAPTARKVMPPASSSTSR
mmetsp:Transcript_27960/g.66623  ORF Transcript_27960/g.66623 Transcript_27960/m.66623 type:complete len:325 (+) Transcript_27960:257-1231(+)